MEPKSKSALLAFAFGAAAVPLGAVLAAAARSVGLSDRLWPLDTMLFVALLSFGVAMRIPAARGFATLGACAVAVVLAIYTVFAGSAAGFAIMVIWMGASFIASGIGEALAWLVRVARRRPHEAQR